MQKTLLPLLFVLALLLSACGAAPAPTQTPTAAASTAAAPTATIQPTPTVAPYTDDQTPCKPLNILDLILPSSKTKLPEVTTSDWVRGSMDAPITLYLYTDLQCPYCAQADSIFNEAAKAFPNDVRLVFRHWPLASIHPNAVQAAIAAEAAGRQGKFFPMTEFLFTNQSEWSGKSTADFVTWLNSKAASLGLNAAKFASDLKDPVIAQKVNADMAASNKLFEELSTTMPEVGGFGTPTLFIENYLFSGLERSVQSISSIINILKFTKSNSLECPAMEIDKNKNYVAKVTTTKGNIIIDLLEKDAPLSVNSFVSLAKKGWFDNNVIFTNEQVIISGDKSNTGYGNAGYAFKDEINSKYNFDKEGMVAMNNFRPGTNGSLFFINKTGFPEINGRYPIFGIVTQGMDVVKTLTLYNGSQPVEQADKIISVTITAE